MHSHRELTALAASNAALRWRITLQRTQCAQAATRVVQPLAWLGQALVRCRQLSPLVKFAALPPGFLLKRSLAPRSRALDTLLGWGPLMSGAVRGLAGARKRSPSV